MTWYRSTGGIPQSVKNLKTPTSLSGAGVLFNTDLTDNLIKCIADIDAVQSGSGVPTPSNPRSISGFSNCVITANSTPVTFALGQTVYGGYIDVLSGVMTITHGMKVYDGSSDEDWIYRSSALGFSVENIEFSGNFVEGISNLFPIRTSTETWTDYTSIRYGIGGSTSSRMIVFKVTSFITGVTDVATWRTWLSNNNLMCVYKLATPTKVLLSDNQIATIIGQNNIQADTGDIDVTYLETVGHKIS